MLQEQIITYIRENPVTTFLAAGIIILFILLLIFIQVTRTRYEETETAEQIPVYRTAEDWKKEQELKKREEDAKLLMDVISEVF